MSIDANKVRNAQNFIRQRWGGLPVPDKSILILMSHRSGSTLLCKHLEMIGYGKPIEAFQYNPQRLTWQYGWEIDLNDPFAYMQMVLEYQTIDGVFATKMSFNQFQIFIKKARILLAEYSEYLNEAELLSVFFPEPYFVHLIRVNKVKQAVSCSRSLQNGIWNLPKDHSNDYKKYLMPAIYDREHIEGCYEKALATDVAWADLLRIHEIPHLRFIFETMISDYHNQMVALHDYLSVDDSIEIPEPAVQKISSASSADWVTRFTKETSWLQDEFFQRAMEAGDFQSAINRRTFMLVNQKEQHRWRTMPANRYKKLRKIFFRIKRKLEEILKIS